MALGVKPQTADGYDPVQTIACERVLVTLLKAFGTLKDSIRLVGGLVPRYLTPEAPPDVPAHAGTTDVDIVFNLQVIAEGEGYASLSDQLKQRGFIRYVRPGGNAPSSWQWEYKIAEHERVVVEFLHNAADRSQEGRLTSIDDEKVSALGIRHAGVVHNWYREKNVTAELFNGGGWTTELVRYADVTSFVILKAIAFDQRAENKDAGDLVHVMRYAGTPEQIGEEIMDRYRSGEHQNAILEALYALQNCFCDGEGVEGYKRNGPIAAARFMLGLDFDDEDERIREQLNVAGLVTEIVTYVQGRIHAQDNSA
jgi:hypothetical protein